MISGKNKEKWVSYRTSEIERLAEPHLNGNKFHDEMLLKALRRSLDETYPKEEEKLEVANKGHKHSEKELMPSGRVKKTTAAKAVDMMAKLAYEDPESFISLVQKEFGLNEKAAKELQQKKRAEYTPPKGKEGK